MKFLNNAVLSVFARPAEEDAAAVRQALAELVPLDLVQEKIAVEQQSAEGFSDQKIHIYTITLAKAAHTNVFLKGLLNRLTTEQKQQLLDQRESRLDSELHFFIRFDKDVWLKSRELVITDSGNCFHVKLQLAAFPARRPDALLLVEKIFKPE
jgi:hypothetical protein